MKNWYHSILFMAIVATLVSCDAFTTLTSSRRKASLGTPYELIVVCQQPQWEGAMGDTLRTILTAPVMYINQREPIFDVLHVTERGFTKMVVDHRNILKINVDPVFDQTAASIEYNITAEPQIVISLQGPTNAAVIDYLSTNREEIVFALESAERNRALDFAAKFNEKHIQEVIKSTFGIEMNIPKGYVLASNSEDFIWARYEYPKASQGFFIYSYPYNGKESLSAQSLIAARNKFAARVPGPSDGSYMITSDVFEPAYKMFRMDGRIWVEMRGFWDVAGNFMGGPYVSYTTVDTQTNRVLTLDCYVYSPDKHKRNYVRGVEHLFHTIKFPTAQSK